MTRKAVRFVLAFSLTLLAHAAAHAAPTRGPAFKIPAPGVIEFPVARAGVAYDFDLRNLLETQGEPPLRWFVTGKPAWLELDATNSRVYGTPGSQHAGTFNFQITVKDKNNEGGEVNRTASIRVLSPPQFKTEKIDLGIQNEDAPWTFDLKTTVVDTTGGPLTWDATGLRPWMRLDKQTGILSGTPRRADVGKYNGIVIIAKSPGGESQAPAFGEVLITIKPPKWVKKEFALEDAYEDAPYSRKLTEFVVRGDATDIKYEIVSATPPPWLQIGASSGTLFGTAKAENVGPATVAVMLSSTINGKTYTDTATFKFSVIHVNHPPEWLSKPLPLPNGATGVAYAQDLSKSARDIDKGDTLKFRIVSYNGPGNNWATIDPNTGAFTGTPDKTNVGDASWVVAVTDQGGLSDQTTVQIKVIKSNEPPYWVEPVALPAAKEDFNYSVDLASYAKDPDNDNLTFTLLDAGTWFQVTPAGVLVGMPVAKDVGVTRFRVRVSDGISGSDVTEIQLVVQATNHAPFWTQNPIRFSHPEEKPMSLNLAPYAKDQDVGDKLAFSLIEGPTWAQLSADGVLSGTPQIEHEGENRFRVRVGDTGGLTADVVVIIDVLNVNHPPYWTQNPINLPNAKEGTPYSASVKDFARDPDPNDSLTFMKVQGPAWVQVSSNGTITGTPRREHVGVNELKVRVMDLANADAVATVRIVVEKVNQCPRWRQNPVQLGVAGEDLTFSFDLATFVADDDGDTLSFKLVDGPKWMFVNTDGSIRGVPMKADIGKYTATFEVTDGQCAAQAKGTGEVEHRNHPPVISPSLPLFTVKERAVFQENLAQPQYVSDPDGDKLTFLLVDGSDWVTLASDGRLTVKPLNKHIKDEPHQLRIKVDDGQVAVYGTLRIKVIRDPRPPVWLEDPVRFEAKTNEPFRESVAGKARDLDGYRVTFQKKDGPSWLSVDSEGNLTGKPQDANLGENTFTLSACNDMLCAEATVLVQVKPGTQIDTIQVDTASPSSKAEYLWVVDNSSHCDKTIKALKKSIGTFYNGLAAVKHAGVFLSADAHKWDGAPIRDGNGPILIRSDASPAADFLKRLDASYSSDHCGNCYNSPIWSMFRFYERAGGISEIYHNGYFTEGVPMDVMIVTNQRDHFKTYTKNNPQMKNWTAADFARSFIEFERNEGQAYRISAIAPACPKLKETSGDPTSAAPENAYRVLVDATGGRYYATGCEFNMEETLADFAQRIAWRATVHGKRRIKLSKQPISVTTIQVSIAGQTLPGNTGAPTDKWYYDAATNEVILRWNLIDDSQVKPGDKIQVEYRVS